MLDVRGAMRRAVEQDHQPAGIAQDRTGAPSAMVTERLDSATALERVEGDRELFAELVRLFVEECPAAVKEMRRVLREGDARLLDRLAHTMKGSSASLGANRVSQAALVLEMRARSAALQNAGELIDSLQAEIDLVLPELESFTRKAMQ